MLALAFLTMLATTAAPPADPDPHHPARDRNPIGLTTAEIRRLFTTLTIPPPQKQMNHWLSWSSWRRTHQALARRAHYRRRLTASTG